MPPWRRSLSLWSSNVSARIHHQSWGGSKEPPHDSFPPGEAMGAAAPDESCTERPTPRNDVVIFTCSLYLWRCPDTPGGVSLRVLLRQWEHGTMLTVGRSACGRPAHHSWWGLGRPQGSPLREKCNRSHAKAQEILGFPVLFSIFYRSRSRTSMAVSLALPKRSMKRLHLTRKA